jgi:hypothetical protein
MSDKKMSWNPFRRPSPRDPEFDRELSFHIDQLTQTGIAQGLSPEEARRRAILDFGGRAKPSNSTAARPCVSSAARPRFPPPSSSLWLSA